MGTSAELRYDGPAQWVDRFSLAYLVIPVALVWLLVGIGIRAKLLAAAEEAGRSTAALARMLEAETAGRLRELDALLRFGGALYLRDPQHAAVADWISLAPDLGILGAAILDSEGMVLDAAGSLPAPPPDPTDRVLLDTIRTDPGNDRLRIGVPHSGPASRRPVIDLARPLRDSEGRLVGIARLSLDADSFSGLYRRLGSQDGIIALVGTDGILHAHVPGPDSLLGTVLPKEQRIIPPAEAPEWSGRRPGALDGIDRFVTWRRVAGYPLMVVVGRDAAAALALARAERAWLIGLGGVLTVLLASVALAVARLRRQEGRSRRQMEAALAHLGQGVLMIDPAGRIAVVNGRTRELLDLPPGLAVPGRPVDEVVEWQARAGEFGGGPAPRMHFSSMGGPGSEPFVTERTRPNGRIIEIRTAYVGDGSHVRTFTDVTEQRRGAEALAAARDRALAAEAALAAALENVPHGVMLVGADDRVQVINRTAIDLIGLTPAEASPGTPVEALIRRQIALGEVEPGSDAVRQTAEGIRSRSGQGLSYERPTRDGRMVEVRTTFLPDRRFIRTYTDVTARHATLRSQEAARLAAEAAVRSRTEFLAVVSHELRTPLNAVIGFTELLLANGPRPDQSADLRMVADAGRQLLGLVDDILDVARLERGRVTLREENFDPRVVLAGLAGLARPRTAAKGLEFALRLDPTLPAAACGDQGRLRQALLRLLDNAVKFTESGRVTVGAACLASDIVGWRLVVTVADTGIGIPPEAQARLFEPFAQVDSSSSRRFGGLGLGLATCRLLVEGMGGSIAVESREGAGTSFRVEVPLRWPAAGPGAVAAPA